MSKQKIFLFASEIAIITGHNPYQKPKKVIDRLISEYFPQLLEGQVTVPLDNREYIEYISKTNNIDISAELKATDNSKNTNEIKAEVQKAAKSAVNTKFGTTYENCGIQEYCRITGFPVTEDTRFRKYKLLETPDFDVYIGGRVDGLLKDPDTGKTVRVIEVKNRMNRLFKKLRDYE